MQVVLAPFGMAATLTGVTCRGEEVKQLLEDWSSFWPLTSNAYLAKDAAGRLSPMPEGVEVCRQTRHFLNPLVTTDEDNLAAMQLPAHSPPLYRYKPASHPSTQCYGSKYIEF